MQNSPYFSFGLLYSCLLTYFSIPYISCKLVTSRGFIRFRFSIFWQEYFRGGAMFILVYHHQESARILKWEEYILCRPDICRPPHKGSRYQCKILPKSGATYSDYLPNYHTGPLSNGQNVISPDSRPGILTLFFT